MSKNAISILSKVEMSLNTKTKWEEPLGLDKKSWKILYNYILDKDQRIDKAKLKLLRDLEYLKDQKRRLMEIITPETGYLKAELEYKIKEKEDLLNILRGD